MSTRVTIRNILAASAIAGTLVAPVAVAYEQAEQKPVKMEQAQSERNSAIKDAWIDGKLETALLFNEHLDSFDIDTKVENGVAYLSGYIESDIDRDLAGEIAKSIEGVTRVENDLVVDANKASAFQQSPEGEERNTFRSAVKNATLTAKVKTKLIANNNTEGLSINVDSDNGQVTLTGSVETEQKKELAGQIAANTSGAMSVENRLNVETSNQ